MKGRHVAKRLAALVGGLVTALVCAEVAWRLFGPRPLAEPTIRTPDGAQVPLATITSFVKRGDVSTPSDGESGPRGRLAPNLDVRFCFDGPPPPNGDADGCIEVRTNALGFRDEEFTADKPTGETRILCVGDSFTFGNGVRAEDTWVEQLEERLAARHAPVQVINAGFATGDHQPGGYDAWIASDGLALAPDLVIVGVCLNDLGDVPMALIAPPVERPWLGGACRILVHLQQLRADRAYALQEFPDARLLLELVPEPWNATRAGLVRIRAACTARGVPFAVVVFPMLERTQTGRYPYQGLHTAIAEFCDAQGITRFDMLDAFLGREARALWAHPTDQHPSPEAHALIANALVGPVEALLFD
jgi:lysophospholipase L1-like esterase